MQITKDLSSKLTYAAKIAAASGALYLSSLANPNTIYAQQPTDTTIAGKAYRCSPAILTDNVKKRVCVYSDFRIPLVKGEVRKVDTLFVTDTVKNTVYVTDTIKSKRIVEESGGEVDLPERPTAMGPPLQIENDDGSGARFHFNPLGGKNDYQVMGFEAGLVWKFFGVSANYARGFTDKTREMVIQAPHNRLDIGTDTRSGFNILGAAVELHPIPYLFVGAGYNVWNQNREILERKVSMPDSTDLAVNSHSHVEDGKAIRYFGGINIPFSNKVWLKLIGGVYKYDKKDEGKLGKPLYFAGVGGSIALK